MADKGSSSSQEKTEEATPKRLRDAREKGQVWKSKDLTMVLNLVAAFMVLAFSLGFMSGQIKGLIKDMIVMMGQSELTLADISTLITRTAWVTAKVSAPVLLTVLVISAVVTFLQVGAVFSADPLKPQTSRLNLIEGFKNMFKAQSMIELAKNIVKLSFVFTIAYLVIGDSLREILMMVTASPESGIKVAGWVVTRFMIRVFIVFVIVSVADMIAQRWNYMKQMRMTKEEVKKEYKQDEGDPLIKSVRKQLYMEMIMSDMPAQVAKSDVVITNPTHLAVALRYDKEANIAPEIMASGQRLYAQRIREIAEEAGIPIVQNIPLAWSLIELEVGDEIPDELFTAVAEVLSFVYSLKDRTDQ